MPKRRDIDGWVSSTTTCVSVQRAIPKLPPHSDHQFSKSGTTYKRSALILLLSQITSNRNFKALGRLSERESYDRIHRFRVASQASVQHKDLPKEEWIKKEDVSYERVYLAFVMRIHSLHDARTSVTSSHTWRRSGKRTWSGPSGTLFKCRRSDLVDNQASY